MSKTSMKIVISSGFSDICFLNGSSPGLQPVQTCKTGGIHNYYSEQTFEHASYIMTKQRQYLQIVNKHELLTTEGHLILYRKESWHKNPQTTHQTTNSRIIKYKVLTNLVISILSLICRLWSFPQDAKPLTVLVLFKSLSFKILKIMLKVCFTYEETINAPFKFAHIKSVQVHFLLPLGKQWM